MIRSFTFCFLLNILRNFLLKKDILVLGQSLRHTVMAVTVILLIFSWFSTHWANTGRTSAALTDQLLVVAALFVFMTPKPRRVPATTWDCVVFCTRSHPQLNLISIKKTHVMMEISQYVCKMTHYRGTQVCPDTPHWPVTWDSPARSQCPRCCPWCWDSPINQKLRWRLRLESQHLHRKHKSKHKQHSLSLSASPSKDKSLSVSVASAASAALS